MIIHARTRSKVQGPKKSVNPMVWWCREFFFLIFSVFIIFRPDVFQILFFGVSLYFKELSVAEHAFGKAFCDNSIFLFPCGGTAKKVDRLVETKKNGKLVACSCLRKPHSANDEK